MTIEDLPIPHLAQLSHAEQMNLILAIRERRRMVPPKPERKVKETTQAKRATRSNKTVEKALSSLTPEQAAALLKALTGG